MMTYRIPTGMMATAKVGVFTEITTRIARRVDNIMAHSLKVLGTLSSRMSMSLEKRFMILPTGVVSKNDIGERKIQNNMEEWRVPEALMSLVSPR